MNCRLVLASLAVALTLPGVSRAGVIINEFVYDDGGTDDREFVELYNNGLVAEDISGWVVTGQDAGGANPAVTITGLLGSNTTVLAPGAYYVVGHTGVLNGNQVAPAAFLENDAETVELRNGATVVDAVVYEANKGATSHGVLPAPVVAQVGPGFWGNHQSSDIAVAPVTNSTGTIARWLDGQDSNNNGRDFGIRLATPGSSNTGAGFSNVYVPPSVDAAVTGSTIPGYAFSFVAPRVIEPTVVDTNNRNAIPNPPNGNTKVHTAWDPSGGGNGAALGTTMVDGGKFDIMAYLDTVDIPVNLAGTTPFRGSEVTFYGIGNSDALTNLTDLQGNLQIGAASVSANGITGVAWVYEKAGLVGGGGASEKLHLVDANDGGNSNSAHASGLDWTILATIDLSASPSDWHKLGIKIDAAGVGKAYFDTQVFNFNTIAGLDGAFSVGYRENLNLPAGTTGVPAYVRPATWTVPEPTTLTLLALSMALVGRRRR